MTAVMVPLSMLGSLLNAELKAANFDARRVMLVKGPAPTTDDTTDGDHPAEATTNPSACAAELQKELGPDGDDITILGLDPGTEGQFPPSNHPNPAIQEFAKNLLKSIATGVSVSYHALTSDVSDANYTASRVASLDERDQWGKLQGWFIHSVNRPVYAAWLEMAVLSGAISLPVVDWKKLLAPKWWPRTWEWVDPLKETQASVLAIRSGLSTYSEELGGLGRNWRKSFRQRKEEEEFEVELGLHLELDSAKAGANAPSDPAYADSEENPAPPAKKAPAPAKGGNDGTE
jgi:lambda family phage portal protein